MNNLKSILFVHLLTLMMLCYSFVGASSLPLDDCSFIREKISQLPTTGGEVEVPSGVYACHSPIILDRSHLRLKGQGEVKIRLTKNANAPVIIMGDATTPPRPLRDIQVSNLQIDGNRWHQKYECWGGYCDTGGTTFVRNNGITVRGVTNGLIKDVYITSTRSGGVVTERGCFDLEIDNLTSVDNEFDGFAGYETFGARLTRLNLSHNRAAGISLDIRFHGNIMRDVKIENNGDVGIFMRDSNFNIFENIRISNSGNHGVFIAKAEDEATCSVNNEFQNLMVSHSRGYGFRLNDECNGNRLAGESIFINNRDGCVSEPISGQVEVVGAIQCVE